MRREVLVVSKLSPEQKQAIRKLWNQEYPAQLGYLDLGELEAYLAGLDDQKHYFSLDDNDNINGWAFSFLRQKERWFAIIVDQGAQQKGLGRAFLSALKHDENELNGWVTDHERYFKADGTRYISPLDFYRHNGFAVCTDVRLEIDTLSAVKVRWKKEVL